MEVIRQHRINGATVSEAKTSMVREHINKETD